MRHALALLLGALLVPVAARAQTYSTICATQTSEALLTCLRTGYTPTTVYSYDRARDTLFAFVDDGDRTRSPTSTSGASSPYAPASTPRRRGATATRTTTPRRARAAARSTPSTSGRSRSARRRGARRPTCTTSTRPVATSTRCAATTLRRSSATARPRAIYRDTLTFAGSTAPAPTASPSRPTAAASSCPAASVRGDIARALFYFRTIYATEATAAPERVAFFEGMKATLLRVAPRRPADRRDEQAQRPACGDLPGAAEPVRARHEPRGAGLLPRAAAGRARRLHRSGRRRSAAVLRWTTESETNNSGFAIETLRGAAWAEAGLRRRARHDDLSA